MGKFSRQTRSSGQRKRKGALFKGRRSTRLNSIGRSRARLDLSDVYGEDSSVRSTLGSSIKRRKIEPGRGRNSVENDSAGVKLKNSNSKAENSKSIRLSMVSDAGSRISTSSDLSPGRNAGSRGKRSYNTVCRGTAASVKGERSPRNFRVRANSALKGQPCVTKDFLTQNLPRSKAASGKEGISSFLLRQLNCEVEDTTAGDTSTSNGSASTSEDERADISCFETADDAAAPFIKTRRQKLRYMKEMSQSLNELKAEFYDKPHLLRNFELKKKEWEAPMRKKFNFTRKIRRNANSKRKGAGQTAEDGTTDCSDIGNGSDITSSEESEDLENCDDKDGSHSECDETSMLSEDGGAGILKSDIPTNVVKVYCTHCWPSFSYPWTTAGQTHSSSTGIIWSTNPDERLLLTNAHSVQYAAVVHVRKRGDHQKYEAKVLCVGYDCDLALLSVCQDEFWQNMNPLVWGSSPRLEDPVTVVGYPVGGDNTSVTQGVVSRIDFQRYTVGCNLLAIQIDAAINGGNSGGPALNKNKECVGIAFQSLKDSDAENIGYIIPSEVVFHFMEDYQKHGRYTGFGNCSFVWQKVENKQMQQYYGIKDKCHGVLINKVDKTSPAYGLLKKGDIILSIDGHEIAADGTVPFTNGERIAFEWLLCQKFAGQTSVFSILRSRRNKEIELPVVKSEPLVPTYLPTEKKPEYFIAGGLVFIPLSELFLSSEYGQECMCRAPGHLVAISNRYHREYEDEQIVLIGHVLAHEITIGYEEFAHHCVRLFNYQKIRNLKHLISLVENCSDDFWRFDLDSEMVIILNADAAKNSLVDILEQNMIPAAKSSGL